MARRRDPNMPVQFQLPWDKFTYIDHAHPTETNLRPALINSIIAFVQEPPPYCLDPWMFKLRSLLPLTEDLQDQLTPYLRGLNDQALLSLVKRFEEYGINVSMGKAITPSQLEELLRDQLNNGREAINQPLLKEIPNLELYSELGRLYHQLPSVIFPAFLAQRGAELGLAEENMQAFNPNLTNDAIYNVNWRRGLMMTHPNQTEQVYYSADTVQQDNEFVTSPVDPLQLYFPTLGDAITTDRWDEWVAQFNYSDIELDQLAFALHESKRLLSRASDVSQPQFWQLRDYLFNNLEQRLFVPMVHLYQFASQLDWERLARVRIKGVDKPISMIMAEKNIVTSIILNGPFEYQSLRDAHLTELRLRVNCRPDLVTVNEDGGVDIYDFKSSLRIDSDLAEQAVAAIYMLATAAALTSGKLNLLTAEPIIMGQVNLHNPLIQEKLNNMSFHLIDLVHGKTRVYKFSEEDRAYFIELLRWLTETKIVYANTLKSNQTSVI